MFKNPSEKLKALVHVITILLMIGSMVTGIIFLLNGEEPELTPMGVLLLIGGPLVAWASSLGILAFCELCENTNKIRRVVEKRDLEDKPFMGQQAAPIQQPVKMQRGAPIQQAPVKMEAKGVWYCGQCGTPNNDKLEFCIECGNVKSN